MVYMVEVKVTTIRHVTVEAGTLEDAERIGLEEAMKLVGGIGGEVVAIYNNPRAFVGEYGDE